MKSKRGLSTVISVMILVMLVVSLVAIVWVFVNNLVKESTEESSSCFGIFDKITINNQYTCYDFANNELQFSIDMGDIIVDKVIVSVLSKAQGSSKNFEISNNLSIIPDLREYPDEAQVKLPGKNNGRTYIASGFLEAPDSIQIALVVNQNTCEVSDSLYEIGDCALFS